MLHITLNRRFHQAIYEAAQADPSFKWSSERRWSFHCESTTSRMMRRSSQRIRSGAELRFFFRVARVDGLGSGVGERVVRQRGGICTRRFGINTKLRIHLRQKLRGIPLVRMLLARAESVHQLAATSSAMPST